jgi:hypothetical protein
MLVISLYAFVFLRIEEKTKVPITPVSIADKIVFEVTELEFLYPNPLIA